MDKPLDIDYQRMTATVPLTKEPVVLVVNDMDARVFALDDYGEFLLKTQGGKVAYIKKGETVKW